MYDFENLSDASCISELTTDGIDFEHFGPMNDVSAPYELVDEMFGSPEKDTSVWYELPQQGTGSICCEGYAAEQLLERKIPIQELIQLSKDNGILLTDVGVSLNDVGSIARSYGLDVWHEKGYSIKAISESLENNEKVLCAVNSTVLYHPDAFDIPNIGADSVVEVIGVGLHAGAADKIYINDPQCPEHILPADNFCKAWQISGNYAIIIGR